MIHRLVKLKRARTDPKHPGMVERFWIGGIVMAGMVVLIPISAVAASGWSIVSSPNITPSGGNRLYGVTCASASDCWAVGNYYDKSANSFDTLTEHDTGSGWTIVSSPAVGAFLYGVACPATSDCWTVGYQASAVADQTLIEHNVGSGWTVFSSPNTMPTDFNLLNGVTCVNVSDCWAVGDSYNPTLGTVHQTLIDHYDGTAWSIVTSANTSSTQQNVLYEVTCVTASDCWTVGSSAGTAGKPTPDKTLIEHYDGATWTIVSSPNTSHSESNYSDLYGVACSGASDCWAIGNHYNCCDSSSSAFTETLIEHYTAGAWTIVGSPSPGGYANNLGLSAGVTCTSDGTCYAVGNYADCAGCPTVTLIERNTGSGWAVVGSPNVTSSQNDALFGVTCTRANDCRAVGYYNNGNCSGCVDQTLIEQMSEPRTGVPEWPAGAVSGLVAAGLGVLFVRTRRRSRRT